MELVLFLFFHQAETPGRQSQGIRCHRLEIAAKDHFSRGNIPGIAASVYINLQSLAVIASGVAQVLVTGFEEGDIA